MRLPLAFANLPKFRETQNTSNSTDNIFRISKQLLKLRLKFLWNVTCHNEEKVLCRYLEKVQSSFVLPTYLGILKIAVFYRYIWNYEFSSHHHVQPNDPFHSTFSSEIEGNIASRSCEEVYFAIHVVEFVHIKILYLKLFVTVEYV